MAIEKGYKYAGLQNGKECWVGNTFGKHGKVAEKECSERCVKDKSRFCGTDYRNNIYSMADDTTDESMNDSEAKCYLARYPDLTKAFGTDLKKAKKHWVEFGIKEKRNKACNVENLEVCSGERCSGYRGTQTKTKSGFTC